ncbi:hypothetical protein Droror1_Dr00012432 [Drosera rotundifolia]
MVSSIGMMDSAFFLSRIEILQWINARLDLNLTKIEEAASGAVQCQLMDMSHPGVVPMNKVNFDARTEYDRIENFKVLQDVFNKLNITKHIEITKLIRGQLLDNLEFLHWVKRHCESVNGGIINENYNPVERRCKASWERYLEGALRNPKLSKEVMILWLSVDLAEKDRDFYFAKLRDIEMLCQMAETENTPMAVAIKRVLYATEKESPLFEAVEILLSKTDASTALTEKSQEDGQ